MLNIDDVLIIKETSIQTKHPCKVSINKQEYKDFMVEYDDKYQIPGVVEIYFPELDDVTQIVTPYIYINLLKTENIVEDKSYINISYEKDDSLIIQEYAEDEVNLPLITKMIDGKLNYIKSPEQLVNLLHNALPKSDLVHLELILSNVFRDGINNQPCRLTGDYTNSKQIGVGQLALTDSWLSALAFQHIDRGIIRGLVYSQPAKMNPLEKVLNEEFQSL
jgi:hypothetical protein